MIAIVRWAPAGAILQASATIWNRTVERLSRAGQISAGRAVVIGLAGAEGPDHARRVTVPADVARIVLQHAPEEQANDR